MHALLPGDVDQRVNVVLLAGRKGFDGRLHRLRLADQFEERPGFDDVAPIQEQRADALGRFANGRFVTLVIFRGHVGGGAGRERTDAELDAGL